MNLLDQYNLINIYDNKLINLCTVYYIDEPISIIDGNLSIGFSLALSTLSLVMSLTSYKEPFKCIHVQCCCCRGCCSNSLPSGKFVALLTANIFGICKPNFRFTFKSSIIYYIFILCTSVSRLVVVVFTIIIVDNFKVIGILVLIHFTSAALWLWGETAYHRYKNDESIKAPYSLTLIEELCLDAVLALVFFFTFFNTRPKWSRLRYVTYYTVLIIQYIEINYLIKMYVDI